jgi:CrcB protein
VSERHVVAREARPGGETRRGVRRAPGLPPPGQIVAVAIGGAVGAPLRYEIGRWFPVTAGRFPVTTLCVNVSGAFVLGALLTVLVERVRPTRHLRALAGTGVLGAFTTFSTFAVEATTLGKDGHVPTALVYVVASLGLGLVAAAAGVTCGRLGRRARTEGHLR